MLDLTKKYKTRDGRAVLHLTSRGENYKGDFTLAGFLIEHDGTIYPSVWHVSGRYFVHPTQSPADLVLADDPALEPDGLTPRGVLLREIYSVKKQLLDAIESSDRNHPRQRGLLTRYQALLEAADALFNLEQKDRA